MLSDLRHILRSLRRSPAWSLTVILTLGLGVGANAMMFGVVDRLMVRPFPLLDQSQEVHRVYLQSTYQGKTRTFSIIPYTRYLDLTRDTRSFAQTAAVTERMLPVGTGPATRERNVVGASAGFFTFFRARPVQGRFFGPAEDLTPVGTPVAVLGFAFWQSEFGGRAALGESIRIGSSDYVIIGVAPRDFIGVSEGTTPAVFIPITSFPLAAGENKANDYYTRYNWDWVTVVARRQPGISEDAASADLTRAYSASRAAQRAITPSVLPDSIAHPRAIAGAIRTPAGPAAGLESRTLLWVTGVAAIVLVIACANVANLMLARMLRRRREIAVRLALGVRRSRLVGQVMLESVVLAGLGGLAGVLIAQWAGIAFRRMVLPPESPLAIVTDWRTLLAAAGIALLAGIATAITPALFAIGGDLTDAFKAGAREGTRQRSVARSLLLILQAALSVMLLVGAHLFVRSLDHVRSVRLGYDPAPVLMAMTEMRGLRLDSASMVTLRRRLLATARGIPGVVAASRVNSRPFGTNTARLIVPGIDSVERLGRFNFQVADPDYFTVMDTRIVRGRGFTNADDERGARVVVVSESMARALWPNRNPLGECITAIFDTGSGETPSCSTVVGVAEDGMNQNLTDDPRFMYYLPMDQVNPAWGTQMFVRVDAGRVGQLGEQVRDRLSAAMPGEGYVTVQPLEDLVLRQQRSWRLGASMFVAFGLLALLVAAVGLYGVIAYDVTSRMHELGVRIALGAQSGHVVRLVVGHGVRLALVGVGIGGLVALLLAPWLEPLLYRQSARDPGTYSQVAGVLLAVAALAAAVPAFRATRADPNAALRSE
ncbi:MAG TPA: ADOP family duplicated permease [Gemmatimonadales bacterium]|nr:ADOP family duplicated permease [Gemmatimonadales bacterium]